MVFVLVFAFIIQSCPSSGKPVEKDFSYPPAMLVETAKAVAAQALSGRVVNGDERNLSDALVEIIDADNKRTVAVFTDGEGNFCFSGIPAGRYVLRISKPQFDTLIVPFSVSRKAKNKSAVIQLHISS